MEDSNVKLGTKNASKTSVGHFGVGARNCIECIVQFAGISKLRIINTFFKKKLAQNERGEVLMEMQQMKSTLSLLIIKT